MTGYESKKAAALDEEGIYLVHQTDHSEVVLNMVAQPTLQEQLDKAHANCNKVYGEFVKAKAAWEKTGAELEKAKEAWGKSGAKWVKADEEIKRIEKIMEQK